MRAASSKICSFFIARKVHKTEKCSQREKMRDGNGKVKCISRVHGDDNMKYDEENS